MSSKWNPCWTVGIYDAPAPKIVERAPIVPDVVTPAKGAKKMKKEESKKKPAAANAKKSSPKKETPNNKVASSNGFGNKGSSKASSKKASTVKKGAPKAVPKKPSAPVKGVSAMIAQAESAVVNKGLTHIKQNKYAPSSEVAASMDDEEFRTSIYKNMKAAERERKASQKGTVGSAISDEYLESLGTRK
jgi:hypothetical protein